MNTYDPSRVVHAFIIRAADAGESMKRATELLAEKFASRYLNLHGKEKEQSLRIDLAQLSDQEEVIEE